MKPDCHFVNDLSAYIDGELPPKRSSEVQDHLDHCPACTQLLASLSSVDEHIGHIPEIEPTAAFSRNFWRRIDGMSRRRRLFWLPRLLRQWKPALATVAGLIVILGALALIQKDQSGTQIGPSEVVIAEQLELLENYEIIRHMEMLEKWETVTGDNGHS